MPQSISFLVEDENELRLQPNQLDTGECKECVKSKSIYAGEGILGELTGWISRGYGEARRVASGRVGGGMG